MERRKMINKGIAQSSSNKTLLEVCAETLEAFKAMDLKNNSNNSNMSNEPITENNAVKE